MRRDRRDRLIGLFQLPTQLKIRVLDSLGCAIGAMDGEPVQIVRRQLDEFDRGGACTLIGGGQVAPDRATFYNGALIRYLDYNDGYLAKGESCHPSDNLSAVLAATEYANGNGRDPLVALAVAYQVQCRLSDEAPVRAAGFDHTTQGAYAEVFEGNKGFIDSLVDTCDSERLKVITVWSEFKDEDLATRGALARVRSGAYTPRDPWSRHRWWGHDFASGLPCR